MSDTITVRKSESQFKPRISAAWFRRAKAPLCGQRLLIIIVDSSNSSCLNHTSNDNGTPPMESMESYHWNHCIVSDRQFIDKTLSYLYDGMRHGSVPPPNNLDLDVSSDYSSTPRDFDDPKYLVEMYIVRA
jgi:hypothetical protein